MWVKNIYRFFLLTAFSAAVSLGFSADEESSLPQFGRDTVLVWDIPIQDVSREFVVRLARFYPDLLMEWEDYQSQGTVFISNLDVLGAEGFINKKLFKSGIDTRSDNETTLWLSRKIFEELKEKKKVKCDIDRVSGRMTYEGDGEISVEVNGDTMILPVIKVRDDRGSERWFLDQADNPLMVRYTLRHYTQTLTSITTDRKNTLRWLKGQKLRRLLPD